MLVFQCSADECVRELYSIQKRSVVCSLQFNETKLNESFCSSLGFPPDNVRDCFNPDCLARWNTSSWSKVGFYIFGLCDHSCMQADTIQQRHENMDLRDSCEQESTRLWSFQYSQWYFIPFTPWVYKWTFPSLILDFSVISSPGSLLQVSLCRGLLSVARPSSIVRPSVVGFSHF